MFWLIAIYQKVLHVISLVCWHHIRVWNAKQK